MSQLFRTLSPLALVLLLVLGLAGCGEQAAPKPTEDAAVPVVVAKVQKRSIPVELHAIGTGQAYKTVSVESQTAGIVKQVQYHQGQYVQQGALLVTLDERPSLAALQQAQASLARDTAQSELSKVEVERYSKLFQSGIIARQQYDQVRATADAANATVRADEAAIETAKIHLSYCSIYAPISGVVGAQLVYPGATVKANDVPVLVIINQVSPLYENFSVPQQYLNDIKGFMAKGRLPVQATPPDSATVENGYLTFVNNTVDTATGTIQLMATFPNATHRLWPGQFSNIVLRLSEQRNAVVVPSQAVQNGQQGSYVFLVQPNMTVVVRQVKLGRTVGGETEITQGVAVGETVVTDGQVRLVPGTKVYFTKGL
jgi:multidrug efflux system membrane fusion protein